MTINPFDEANRLRLEQSVLSPNLFHVASTSTPERDLTDSLWNIDQRAVLYPADIPTDEISLYAQYIATNDDVDEADVLKTNAALEAFWTQNQIIIESPLASKSRYLERYREAKPPLNDPHNDFHHQTESIQSNEKESTTTMNTTSTSKRNTTCQTILSFNPQAKLTIDKEFLASHVSTPLNRSLVTYKHSASTSIEQRNTLNNNNNNNNRSWPTSHDERTKTKNNVRSRKPEEANKTSSSSRRSTTATRRRRRRRAEMGEDDSDDKGSRLESPNLSPIRAVTSSPDSMLSPDSPLSFDADCQTNRKLNLATKTTSASVTTSTRERKTTNRGSDDSDSSLPESEILVKRELDEIMCAARKRDSELNRRISELNIECDDDYENMAAAKTNTSNNGLSIEIIRINTNAVLSLSLNEGKHHQKQKQQQHRKDGVFNRSQPSLNETKMIMLNQESQDTGYHTTNATAIAATTTTTTTTTTSNGNSYEVGNGSMQSNEATTRRAASSSNYKKSLRFNISSKSSTLSDEYEMMLNDERTRGDAKMMPTPCNIVDNVEAWLNNAASTTKNKNGSRVAGSISSHLNAPDGSERSNRISASEYAFRVIEKAKSELIKSQKYLK